jgi:alpha-amylase/alpha-mannosidase (GH57 family)
VNNTSNALCIHAHFYQPPREHPFTGTIPQELGAEPYHDYNEKITAECYQPNAALGNYERISFNIGPTLASWIENHASDTYERILAADKLRHNAIAQVYNHTILPLATERDREIQIAWGIADFVARFGRRPQGIWLAETAVDLPTLDSLARAGIEFTILAAWQASGNDPQHTSTLDATQPYRVELPEGRHITVFFYDPNLSGVIHRPNPISAHELAHVGLPMRLDNQWFGPRGDQLILGASDGEYYGHHLPGRAEWLRDLTQTEAPNAGFQVVVLSEWLANHPPQQTIGIREGTAWSCAHELDRWHRDCDCVRAYGALQATGNWKIGLRVALDRLADLIDSVYVAATIPWLKDPYQARIDLLAPYTGRRLWDDFFEHHGTMRLASLADSDRVAQTERLRALLEGQYYRQLMFTSCGFFFEDLERIEPINNLRYAGKAIRLTERGAPDVSGLTDSFVSLLATSRSERTGRTAADIFAAEMQNM